RARYRDPAMGRQGDADRAQEHHPARRDPPDDGEADDGRANASRRRHHRRRREVVGDPAGGRPEAGRDRQRGGLEGGGDSRGRGSGAGAASHRTGRSAGHPTGHAGARRRRQSGAVPDRAEVSRGARADLQQRAEDRVPTVRDQRCNGVARRHPRAADSRKVRVCVMKRLMLGVSLVLSVGANALAQDAGQVGVLLGYPSAVGVIWHVTDNVAVRPEISFAPGSTENPVISSGLPLPGLSDDLGDTSTTAVTAGVSGLFYFGQWDKLRAYVSPRYTYARLTAETGSGST